MSLADDSKLLAFVCIVLAGDSNNMIPLDRDFIQSRGGLKKRPDIRPLIKVGFAEVFEECLQLASTLPPPSLSETEAYKQETDKTETESPHLEKRDLEPPSNSDELIEQIAKLHPANWHWKKSSSIQIPPAQCDSIIRAFGRDGFDVVLAGTKNYAEAVNGWPIEGRRFVKGVVKFYDDKDYLRDPREWKTEKTSDKWEKFMEAKA